MLRLREARKENSMTQTQVAKYLNVTTATYNRYEKGVIRPDPDTLKNLASLFNVSVDYLLGLPPSARDIPQCIDLNTSHIDKALGRIKAERAAQLAGKLLALGDAEKVDVTLELLEHLSEMEHKQLEALRDFLRTIK